MALSKTQRRNLNKVFQAMNPDDILWGSELTTRERIEMYRQSARDDRRRLRLERTFLFIWRDRKPRTRGYTLCDGDARDLLGAFYRRE